MADPIVGYKRATADSIPSSVIKNCGNSGVDLEYRVFASGRRSEGFKSLEDAIAPPRAKANGESAE